MAFITKLRGTTHGVDFIWVIIDRLTKSVHFIPIVESISVEKLAAIYIREVVVWHVVPILVVSDRGICFNSRFWRKFQEELGN